MLSSISKIVQEKVRNPFNEDSDRVKAGEYNSFDAPENLF